MVAGLLPAAHLAVDLGVDQPLGQRRAQQEVIDAQAGIARIGIPEIVEEGVDRLVRMVGPQRVGPALLQQPKERRTDLGREQRVLGPALGLVDVPFGRHHVEVTGDHDGSA